MSCGRVLLSLGEMVDLRLCMHTISFFVLSYFPYISCSMYCMRDTSRFLRFPYGFQLTPGSVLCYFLPSADPVTEYSQGAPAQRGNWQPRYVPRGGRGR